MGPIQAGLITIDQLYRPGIGYDDILDLNEILVVKYENEYRAHKAAEAKK